MKMRFGLLFASIILVCLPASMLGQTQGAQNNTVQTAPTGATQLPVAAAPLDPTKTGVLPLNQQTDGTDAGTTGQSASNASQLTTSNASGTPDLRYRIGVGDVLDIRIFDRPTLSRDGVRVDASGTIRMPLIRGDIEAACLTEGELAQQIAKGYSEYLKDPQVDVFVKEFNAQPVSLIGALLKPGSYQLQRRIRLRELLMIAGGPLTTAGGQIQIMHDETQKSCEQEPQRRMLSLDDPGVTMLNLDDVIRGDPKSNPYVRAGDFINLPEANQAYVVGNVFKPTSIALNGTITMSRAIAMAGGALPNSKSEVRLLRLNPDKNGSREIHINLKELERNPTEDLALRAGDIVEVPLAQGKLILKSIFTTVASGALLYYPLTVIH